MAERDKGNGCCLVHHVSYSWRAMAQEVRAHITGTVWKIEVSSGDTVEEEQTLVILESMKMEMPVEAPCAGRVAMVVVVEGQSVEEEDLLLTLDPA